MTFTALAVTALLAGCGGEPDEAGLVVPGDRVFPEGIAVDKRSGDLYVGSTTDGTIFRASPGAERFEEFLPPGGDGRSAATGLKVDPRGRLFVAGRSTGRLFVYDLRTRRLLRSLEAPGSGRTLVNDLTFTPDAAYVTDSYRPVVYRVPLAGDDVGAMEPWLDLRDTPVPTDTAFGLNGISASDDGRHLLTVHFDTGRLFRIDTASRVVREVDLGDATLRTGDGLLLDGTTLLAVCEEPGEVVPIRLSADLLRGEVLPAFGREELDFPTTLAENDGSVFVVNSQLDGAPDAAQPPFTVAELPLPKELRGP